MLIGTLLTLLPAAAPGPAIAALAGGDEAAVQRLIALGQPGLWALHAAAKNAEGVERARLFEAIGRFRSSEAEWALAIELKGDRVEGRAGAVRGLGHAGSKSAIATLIRFAGIADEGLRAGVVDALAELGGPTPAQLSSMIASPAEGSREVALAWVAEQGSSEQVAAAIAPGLADPSPRVRRQAVALVVKARDQSRVFDLAEIARGDEEALAVEAVGALGVLGGWSVTAELATVVADARAKPQAQRRAVEVLRTLDRSGFGALIKAIARTTDAARGEALTSAAAAGITAEEIEAALDLLDDPGAGPVAQAVLARAGAPAAEAARARLPGALPELALAITTFLAARPGPTGAELRSAAPNALASP